MAASNESSPHGTAPGQQPLANPGRMRTKRATRVVVMRGPSRVGERGLPSPVHIFYNRPADVDCYIRAAGRTARSVGFDRCGRQGIDARGMLDSSTQLNSTQLNSSQLISTVCLSRFPMWSARYRCVGGIHRSISASPVACLVHGYDRAGTHCHRPSKSFLMTRSRCRTRIDTHGDTHLRSVGLRGVGRRSQSACMRAQHGAHVRTRVCVKIRRSILLRINDAGHRSYYSGLTMLVTVHYEGL